MHSECGRKGQRYSKLSLKAEIGRRAAEHIMAARVRLYAKKLPDRWTMVMVNLKVGEASMA